MKLTSFLTILTFSVLFGNAQTTFYLQDLNGQPIKGNYSNVAGNPYLFDGWKEGSVILENQSKYDNILLKYDIVRDVLIFKKDRTSDAEGFEFSSRPVEFKFNDSEGIFLPRNSLLKQSKENDFLELVYNGSVSLLKKYRKRLVTKREYNSAITEQQIEEFYTFFILNSKSGQFEEIKGLNEKALMPFLADKANKVKDYAASKRLSFKKEADVVSILTYYNSIN